MKILLTENEQYEIKLPEQTDLQGLSMIASRFNSLLKNFSKINPMSEDENGKEIVLDKKTNRIGGKHNKEQWDKFRTDRKLFLKFLNLYYNGTPEDFEKFKAENNITIARTSMANVGLIRIREMHRVKPSELGLTKFPSKHDTIENLRIKK